MVLIEMKLIRYVCGCDTWNLPCYQSGRNHYIALPETEDDKTFELRITEFEQKGKQIWLGGKEAHIIDFLSRVPQVEDHLKQSDLSLKLGRKKDYPRYQRRLDVPRAESIGEWWSKPDTSSVNAVVLAVNSTHNVGEDGDLTNPNIHIHKEFIEGNDSFVILKIKTDWLGNSCESCGNVKSQLEKVVTGTSELYTPEMKENAKNVLAEIKTWADDEEWRTPDHALTFHCLNRDCPSFDDDGKSKYHQHKSLKNGGNSVPPFEIIDGQHRVKGSQQMSSIKPPKASRCNTCDDGIVKPSCEEIDDIHNLEYGIPPCEEKIAFSLVAKEGSFGDGFHGKLFTEITTEARKLAPEHQLYMQWRFEMQTHRPSDLFEKGMDYTPTSVLALDGKFDYSADSISDMTYRIILALNKSGRLAGRIRPLGAVNEGEGEKHKAYYLGSMKNMWIWIYDLVCEYFNQLITLKEDGTNKQMFSAKSDANIEAIRKVISDYFEACINKFTIPLADWAPSIEESGRLTGPSKKDGSAEDATGPVFHFQVMAYLAKYVFKEVAWDIYFQQNPEANEQEVQTQGDLWMKQDPSTFTIEQMESVLSSLDGFDFGQTDGSSKDYYPNSARGYLLADDLAPFIEKPRTNTVQKSKIIVEAEDLGGI
jgi:hypothetical protein